MKTFNTTIFLASLLLIVSCNTGESSNGSRTMAPEVNLEKEKEAIIAVIEEEKNAFYDQDLERITDTWLDDESTRKVMMRAGDYSEIVGIKAIIQNNKESLAVEMGEGVTWESSYYNYDIQVYGNSALVYHNSKHKSSGLDPEMGSTMLRIVHLVKEKGQWKMDMMTLLMEEMK